MIHVGWCWWSLGNVILCGGVKGNLSAHPPLSTTLFWTRRIPPQRLNQALSIDPCICAFPLHPHRLGQADTPRLDAPHQPPNSYMPLRNPAGQSCFRVGAGLVRHNNARARAQLHPRKSSIFFRQRKITLPKKKKKKLPLSSEWSSFSWALVRN